MGMRDAGYGFMGYGFMACVMLKAFYLELEYGYG